MTLYIKQKAPCFKELFALLMRTGRDSNPRPRA